LAIEEIAARFFVSAQVVRQRLKLAAARPKLLDFYVAEEMSLEQLMAFTVSEDHARQEQVWESLSRAFNKEPHTIRRMLTEGAIKTSDRRGLVARRFRKARRRRLGINYATLTKLACPSLRIRLSDLIAIATSVTRRASSCDFKVSPMTRL